MIRTYDQEEVYLKHIAFKKFNPETYIKVPLDTLVKAYKYKGNLYTFDELYTTLKNSGVIDIAKASFNKWKDKEVREWYDWRVNVVYLAPINMNNGRVYYISTDGVFYNPSYEDITWSGERCDRVEITDNGEKAFYRAGYYVLGKFIDPDYYHEEQYINNYDFSLANNRVDNVGPWVPPQVQKAKAKKKGEVR